VNLPKRTLFVIPVATALALATGGGTAAAAALPDGNANCIAAVTVSANKSGLTFGSPGVGGQQVSDAAQAFGGMGSIATSPFCN
jgi:hypothetical protein